MKYSADDIVVDKWAESKQTPDGKCKQIWDIILKKPIVGTTNIKNISQEISHEDFDVLLNIKQGKHLTVFVSFYMDTNLYSHDPIVFSIFKMFEDIERLLGKIDTIQGQKREDRWSPYKLSKKTESS
ncbi:MAG: hypothetical protein V7K53_26080 [Nostoc sp.]|uniref:hypothetical protein n=1 Tax=Nostoc sp. TaxID=1180 RepID=UPI002FF6994D